MKYKVLGSFSLMVGVLAILILAAACGGSSTSTPAGTPAQPTPAPTVTPAPPPTPVPSPTTVHLTTPEVVRIVRPSVVHIQTEAVSLDFSSQLVPTGVGTGVIIDDQGHILTNNHVIQGADRIVVSLIDDRDFIAEVVGRDPSTDLAVIRIPTTEYQPAKLGDSSNLELGEDVVAIGHALDLSGGPTVSKGVTSALNRSIQIDAQTTLQGLIQTDAAINPGNSGGPLVNAQGEVIGINTAIRGDARGIGFAININNAKLVAAQLIENGFVKRGFLGIALVNITSSLAINRNLPVERGVGIVSLAPGSPADLGGLRAGDILVKMGDEQVENSADLIHFLTRHLAGERVSVTFFRGDDERTTEVVLGERPR